MVDHLVIFTNLTQLQKMVNETPIHYVVNLALEAGKTLLFE